MSRFPFPVPNGWFAVATSEEIGPGEVKNVHYFGEDLVVFRGESGEAAVLDAYCVHMGAHLGVGAGAPDSKEPGPGTVTGDCVVCPFHGWQYDGSGKVVEIPYSEGRIPPRARVKGWPTIEKNGLIFAWHHLLDEPPAWDLPDVPEFTDDEWVGPVFTERWVDTCLQEMAENDQDNVHFHYVHGQDEIPPVGEVTFDGHRRTTVTEAPPAFGGGTFTRETHQLGFVILRITDLVSFIAASSPIDAEHTHQRWLFAYPKAIGDEAGQAIIDGFASSGIYQDIPIWEHKRYVERPMLVKEDGPIADFRRWVKQFYSELPADASSDGAEVGVRNGRSRAGV